MYKQVSVSGCWGIHLFSIFLGWPFKNVFSPPLEQGVGGTQGVFCANHEVPCSVSP